MTHNDNSFPTLNEDDLKAYLGSCPRDESGASCIAYLDGQPCDEGILDDFILMNDAIKTLPCGKSENGSNWPTSK